MRLNEYRIMWILVFYDLPTETDAEKKAHAHFRKDIMKQGFNMFQFSIYTRHCSSRENADAHVKGIKKLLPEHGKVGILTITDKQFGMIELFYGIKQQLLPSPITQLAMF